jgi:glutathione S-transferase
MRLHDNLSSGHGYKVRLLLTQLGVPFERVEYDIDRGETRTARFLQEVNPNGRIPVLETDGGEFLPESNAILFYRAEGSPLLSEGRTGRARLLQWMFFEQYRRSSQNACAWVPRPADRRRRRAAIADDGLEKERHTPPSFDGSALGDGAKLAKGTYGITIGEVNGGG